MLMTMSSSVAPSSIARSASKTFTAVRCPPCGKPIVVPDGDAGAVQDPFRQRDGIGLDAHAGNVVLGGQSAAGLQVGIGQSGAKQGVVDPPGDRLVGQVHVGLLPLSSTNESIG